MLCSVAERLSACVGRDDTLARVGGDEFVIVNSNYENTGHLIGLAQRILDMIAVPFAVAGNEYYLGASIGISLFPEDGHDVATLMRNADSAMYHAKQRGRNNFQFFTAELNQHLQRRFTIEQSLRRALAADELSLVYQPIVDSQDGRTIGAEALLRWYNSELGNVSPAEFIPVAEDAGLIIEIGDWVLARACQQVAQWRRTLAPDLIVAVNLSPRQFNDGLLERIERCLKQSGLEPAALELEITERLLMSDSESVLPMLAALSAMGVRISVDDFGTGYSSLSYLKRFPLHNLKIDRSFVAGLPDHRDSIAITQAVVAMAHSLGMNVTAEGVETAEQAAFCGRSPATSNRDICTAARSGRARMHAVCAARRWGWSTWASLDWLGHLPDMARAYAGYFPVVSPRPLRGGGSALIRPPDCSVSQTSAFAFPVFIRRTRSP